jgi:hypothetical protein
MNYFLDSTEFSFLAAQYIFGKIAFKVIKKV